MRVAVAWGAAASAPRPMAASVAAADVAPPGRGATTRFPATTPTRTRSTGSRSARLVALDTTRPGEDPGALDEERLAWLDAELAAAPDVPTVIAMHHPPLATGVPPLDEIGLPAADRRALATVVERHPQVRRLVAGHMHRAIGADLAGRAVLAVPSTYMQARLDLSSGELQVVPGPAGFAVHALLDGEVISHLQWVGKP
jgi:3',5'-cyclic AMP phosphodiesterase CpdA